MLLRAEHAGRANHANGAMPADAIPSVDPFPEAFLGCYWFFCRLPLDRHAILRSVMHLGRSANGVETRFFERVQPGFPPLRAGIRRNRGTATWTAEKIFIHESPIARPAGPSLLVVLPDHEGPVTTLHGLQLYNLTSGARLPYAIRVTLRRIRGTHTALDVLKACGVFRADDPSIEDDIRAATQNPMASGESVIFPYLA